jgi:hypothetical protein
MFPVPLVVAKTDGVNGDAFAKTCVFVGAHVTVWLCGVVMVNTTSLNAEASVAVPAADARTTQAPAEVKEITGGLDPETVQPVVPALFTA